MSRSCPKCRYQRQPGDTAPGWQCPSCGIAYDKYLQSREDRRDAAVVAGKSSHGLLLLFSFTVVVAVILVAVIGFSSSGSSARVVAGGSNIILYSTRRCGYCKLVRDWFDRDGIAYDERDVERSPEAYREWRNLGGRGVPVLVISGRVIHGYAPSLIKKSLSKLGYK